MHPLFYITAILAVISIIGNGYQWWQHEIITSDLASTTSAAASTTASLEEKLKVASSTIDSLSFDMENLTERYEKLSDDYKEEKERNEEFEDQIRSLGKTVKTLDKLSKTDEELLQKYSKVYFLNENYIPSKLKQIDDKYAQPGKELLFFHTDALPYLEDLIEDAAKDDITLQIVSAYRSFDHQADLKGSYTQVYGSGANTFSADQGYSEHQLGTTVDLTDPSTNGTYLSFKDTEAYAWLLDNAYKYGFVLSYPENNSYYIFEPWHWRFVGRDLAEYLYDNNLHFYDLDQRTIDTYLVKLFD